MPADAVAAVSAVKRSRMLLCRFNSSLAFLRREPHVCSTERITAPRSCQSVNGFFLFFFFKCSPYTHTGVCIPFDLIMHANSSGRECWLLIGCCHLNQMFRGNFSPGRSHTKDYANTGLQAYAIIFDSVAIRNSLIQDQSGLFVGLYMGALYMVKSNRSC